MKKISIVFLLFLMNCTVETPTKFTEKALNESMISLQNESISFQEIIQKYQGKKVLINVWASWCADCIRSLPELKKMQKAHPSVAFLHISADENSMAWKKGIQRFQILGDHYNLPKGTKNGDFVDFINLRGIPRYIVLDEKGTIAVFKAGKITSDRILDALKSN